MQANPFPEHPLPLYLVRLDRPTPFRDRVLEPETYVCDHVTLSLLSAYAVPVFVETLPPDAGGDEGTTLIMPGVHGDLLMLTAINHDPGTRVACFSDYAGILEGSGLKTVELPCVYEPTHAYINLSHLTERPEVVGMSFTDGLREMGFDVGGRLEYAVSTTEREFAKLAWPRERQTVRIALQPFATSRVRTYPFLTELTTLIDKELDPIPEILILCDEPIKIPQKVAHRVKQTTDFHCSLRQAAAMMAECDILVCPDSVFQHIAGALSFPTVALFGPFHWTERVLNRRCVKAIQGNAECGPCRHHSGSTQGAVHPDDPRCSVPGKGYCKAMASIEPERIVAEIKRVLKGGAGT